MAKILIRPVETVTVGGFKAVVDGLYPISTDLLMGKVYSSYYPSGKDVSWDASGICRDNESSFNISLRDNDELEEVLRTATALSLR